MTLKVVSFKDTEQTIEAIDNNGDSVSIDIVVPPCNSSIRRGLTNVWYVFDDEMDPSATVLSGAAKLSAIPERLDLPEDHPLYRTRSLAVVPSGFPDITYDSEAGSFDIDEAPLSPAPLEIERDR
jgi:hypothetical protein